MSFEFRPAKRENVPLLIGLAGGTGSGKTYSGMQIAKGLAGGKRFAVIDTENGRAKHYADEFAFDVAELHAPFRPEAYAEAIAAADAKGYPVILVDSMSHEHAGEGGLLDWHESELQRMAGDDFKRRDALTFAAWIKPKQAHKRMVNRLLQLQAHLILCFRAEEKIEITKGPDGKTKVVPKRSLTGLDGWIPVTEKNLPYELTLSVLLTADAPGVPKPIKVQAQHRPFVPLDKPLGESTGEALGRWAAGGKEPRQQVPASEPSPSVDIDFGDAEEDGTGEAAALTEELLAFARSQRKLTEVRAAITRNRGEHGDDPEAHLDWLRKQRERAEAAAGGESEFAAIARAAGAPV